MATLKMLDPRPTVNPEDRPLVPALDTLEGKVIGIIDNGQSNSTTMFQELAELLRERFRRAAAGPIRKKLDINCDAGVFDPGYRANATIGRAVRLILITVGGGFPGETDRSTFGWPGKYTFCFGENEEKSPWEPYHIEEGFKSEQSTVTVCGINGFLPIHTSGNRGEQALESLAEVIAMHRGVSHLDVGSFGGGTPLVALGIEDAEIMARDGITKRQVKEYLWKHSIIPFASIDARRKGAKTDDELIKESPNVTPDGKVHLATRPEDIMVVVLGGKHRHSVFLPMWTGRNTLSVIKLVR